MKRKLPEVIDEREDVRANPDQLREDQGMYYGNHITDVQMLMGIAVEHLQGRQRQVYLLTMREGVSIAKAAAALGITKSTCQVYRDRANKFVLQYCRRVINNTKS